MKFVIQRVNHAEVKVDGEIVGKIGKGFLVLIGVGREDTREDADWYLKKLLDFVFLRMKMERPICLWQM